MRSRRGEAGVPGLTEGVGPHRRRLVVVVGTLVVGSMLLAATLRTPAGSTSFVIVGCSLAVTWISGSVVSEPIPLKIVGASALANSVRGLMLGVLAFCGFLALSLVGRHLPIVSPALHDVLRTAETGPAALILFVALLNGLGEEMFFRGALFDALGTHHPVPGSVVIYVVVTAASGNIALVLAALVMGYLFSLERARTGGVAASTATHLCWSTLMLLALPK